jgi:hypothetical protein
MHEPLYAALLDEVQRFNHAIHLGLRPSIYRAGVTFIIEYAELESDRLWFYCIKLEWNGVEKHLYTPHVQEYTWYCYGQSEWAVLLWQSGLRRNSYFNVRTT